MSNTITNTDFKFTGLKNIYRGKVREVYTLENEVLVMIASDRISAFDHILPKGIPYKGQVLNQVATMFLDATRDIVPNWLLGTPDPSVAVGHACEPIRVEMVIRGYLAGHSAREYALGKRSLCGVTLPEGLKENDIDFDITDYNAQVEIFWGHPPYEFSNSKMYKIGYTAWESTGFKPHWLESMEDVDEIWTPSTWLSEHFAKETGKPVFTYSHGVDPEWKPIRRYRPADHEPFRFLHIGEPQFRKNGQLVVEAFGELFGNNPNYQLVMKTAGINTTRIYNSQGSIIGSPESVYKNIVFVETILDKDQLIRLHNRSHALLYPTSGEGFGFHPLEAAASGMPTISTTNWCDYKEFISVGIDAPLVDSPWQELHPGKMFHPTKDQIKEAMIDMVENYEKHSKDAFKNSFSVHDKWNWKVQNKKAAERLKDIYFSRILNQ
jgi:glycosyltransferase involved in cell wall biosynthesis